ncbi:hypothetical protein MAR_012647 [Mya arenaria]|uniref:Tyr recombinase domain-containing protein n=1 Tax=Mya arenaria TaxID=6604 RepID=A0ABY7FXJ7_MYAAR|nr:hypothetical protein MAR_012647 [Mya arenaria]
METLTYSYCINAEKLLICVSLFGRCFLLDSKISILCTVMVLSSSPRVFTKILKPAFTHLRARGHISTVYIDESCLQKTLCIVMLLDKYLSRTAGLRMGDKLMISTHKPNKGVSRDTISRWVKTILIKSGLENKAASTSTAKSAGVDLGTIIKTTGWTNAHTFAKFYDKEILSQKTVHDAVLSNLLVDS